MRLHRQPTVGFRKAMLKMPGFFFFSTSKYIKKKIVNKELGMCFPTMIGMNLEYDFRFTMILKGQKKTYGYYTDKDKCLFLSFSGFTFFPWS